MKRKILIVDDNEVNRQLLCKILSDSYDILEADNGMEALNIMNLYASELSAVLLDIIMPVMDGFEVLDVVKNDNKLSQIPIIVITINTDESAEEKALILGAKDYILKPFSPTIIKHRLYNTIRLRETAAFINATKKDKLTGIYNREGFFEKAEEMIHAKEAGYYVMACFDVDNFKVINDQYGVQKGDEVLKSLAEIFEKGFEKVGGICCRIMADNFAILYPRTFMETKEIEEIRKQATILDRSILPITFSIGRYPVDDLSVSVSAMYDRASIAQMSVKRRFDVHIAQYEESMREHILREQEIINEMNFALKDKQFEVWIQPQYNHSTGALVGGEALVRWRHPEKGIISPGVFIPVFEKNGFIYELDKYVWEQACIYLKRWRRRGRLEIPISVNISRYDIFREDLLEVLTGLLSKYEIPVHLLRLEITESAFTQSTGQIIRVTRDLINYGFTIEIDDFGSGYSSLNTLKDVSADILKLDMRFLEKTENSARGGNILESVIRMAKWLGMAVIAEGVEEKEQADYLQSIGCNYIQGYYYAKPMTAVEFEGLALTSKKEKKMTLLKTVNSMDNNVFWDPMSIDTLVFNSYVGGANVFEYDNGKIEVLRANEKYAMVLCGEECTTEEALRISWKDQIAEEDRLTVRNALLQAIHTGEEVSCEARFINLPGKRKSTHLKASIRVIAQVDDKYLLYCMVENITAQKEAETAIVDKTKQLEFLNDTAHDLLAELDIDIGMKRALFSIMNYFGGERAYVIEINYSDNVMSNTYEVCKEGINSKKEELQRLPLDTEQNIYSAFTVPFKKENMLLGYLGVDNPQKKVSHIDILMIVGEYISSILMRRDLKAKIENDKNKLINLMNDTPGGFTRIQLMPDNTAKIVFANKRFCELKGMTQKELMDTEGMDALSGVHPDDVKTATDAVKKLVNEGKTASIKIRLRHSNGGYIWFMIFGRISKDEDGDLFINAYYKDLPETLDI